MVTKLCSVQWKAPIITIDSDKGYSSRSFAPSSFAVIATHTDTKSHTHTHGFLVQTFSLRPEDFEGDSGSSVNDRILGWFLTVEIISLETDFDKFDSESALSDSTIMFKLTVEIPIKLTLTRRCHVFTTRIYCCATIIIAVVGGAPLRNSFVWVSTHSMTRGRGVSVLICQRAIEGFHYWWSLDADHVLGGSWMIVFLQFCLFWKKIVEKLVYLNVNKVHGIVN